MRVWHGDYEEDLFRTGLVYVGELEPDPLPWKVGEEAEAGLIRGSFTTWKEAMRFAHEEARRGAAVRV